MPDPVVLSLVITLITKYLMKSLKFCTDKQRAFLAGDPGANPVSATVNPREQFVLDGGLVDSKDDEVVSLKVSQGSHEQGVLEHTGLRHPLEVLVRCLPPATYVSIQISSEPFSIQLPRFPFGSEELYDLKPVKK